MENDAAVYAAESVLGANIALKIIDALGRESAGLQTGIPLLVPFNLGVPWEQCDAWQVQLEQEITYRMCDPYTISPAGAGLVEQLLRDVFHGWELREGRWWAKAQEVHQETMEAQQRCQAAADLKSTQETLIIALCREAGDRDEATALLAGWTSNHAACCGERIEAAAHGSAAALIQIRLCMGLPLTR